MKKILFLIALFVATPFLARSESGIKVQVPDGSIEVKTGTPPPPAPNPVIVVHPTPQVVEKTTVVEQPKAASGCGCSLDSGGSCK